MGRCVQARSAVRGELVVCARSAGSLEDLVSGRPGFGCLLDILRLKRLSGGSSLHPPASGRLAVSAQQQRPEGRSPLVCDRIRPLRWRKRSIDHVDLSGEATPDLQPGAGVLRGRSYQDDRVPAVPLRQETSELRLAARRCRVGVEAGHLDSGYLRCADTAATPVRRATGDHDTRRPMRPRQAQGGIRAVAGPVQHDDRVDARGHALLRPDEQARRGDPLWPASMINSAITMYFLLLRRCPPCQDQVRHQGQQLLVELEG